MPKIRISPKGRWGARFELNLDGETIGFISTGETKDFDVAVGEHTLEAKMLQYGSKIFKFTIFNKEIKSLSVFPNMIARIFVYVGLLNFCLAAFLMVAKYKFHHSFSSLYLVFFLILILSYYFLRVRRNRYLIIKEG